MMKREIGTCTPIPYTAIPITIYLVSYTMIILESKIIVGEIVSYAYASI